MSPPLSVRELKINILILPVIALFFTMLATSIWAGDFEDGLKFSMDGNYNSAVKSFRKAAELGDVEAQFNLALMYEEGLGVARDYKQAASWFLVAAEQDHAGAQSMLGWMIFQGWGIKQDKIEAYKWLSIAKKNNKRVAGKKLGKVASQMTQLQIAEAQLRASQWLKAHPKIKSK